MNNNKVSIITPAHNSAKYIADTIESVINQTYQNWEMIIIDDYSTDNSKDIINEYSKKDKRIVPIFLETNLGAAQARNSGLKIASGRYIAFLDSDDQWFQYKLEKQVKFMQDKNISFSFTSYEVINDDGSPAKKIIKAPKKINYNSYLRNTIIGCLTVIIDKSKTGDFLMPNIKSSHDMALWLSLLKKGHNAFGMDECLAKYRIVSDSNTANKWKAAKDVWKVYRNIEHLGIIYSLFCFLNYSINASVKRIYFKK